jgi:putative nucleotidyltransferase with HDIG domain
MGEQDSPYVEDQPLREMQQRVQRQLADLSGELLDLARLLDQSMTALQALPVGSARVPVEIRARTEALAHNRGAMTQLSRIQQSLTQLRVSLDHTAPAGMQRKKDREHLSALLEVSQALNSTLDLDGLLNRAIDMIIETTRAERGFLMLYETSEEEEEPTLNFKVARNMDRQTIAGPSFEISRSIISHVATTGQPIFTTNAQMDPRFDNQASVIGYGLRSILCTALSVKDRVTGVIYVDSRIKTGLFSLRDLDFLVAFANQAAMAIENASLYQAVSDGYLDTIKALAAAIDQRDPRTFGHSERVTRYAMRMAEVLQLADQQRETLRYAAILHDIGKIGVDDAILRKPGLLSPEEEDIMCSHPGIGTLIIDGIEFLKDTRPLIRHHHERWDGKGYPDGLSGEDIPLGARILNIIDAYDAMVFPRLYRKPIGKREAVAELRAGRGTQFDPVLVDIFIHEVVPELRWDAFKGPASQLPDDKWE